MTARTTLPSLPPWEETVEEAAAWDRQWGDRDDDEECD